MGKEELQIYTLEEVAKHNTEDSIWIVMDDKIYDVTKFHMEHPGGGEVIVELGGQDATEGFNDAGHSTDALEMAEDYVIGRLPPAETPKKLEENGADADGKSVKRRISCKPSIWLYLIIFVVACTSIFLVYRLVL